MIACHHGVSGSFCSCECSHGCLAKLCWSTHMVKLSAQGCSKLLEGGATKVTCVNFFNLLAQRSYLNFFFGGGGGGGGLKCCIFCRSWKTGFES